MFLVISLFSVKEQTKEFTCESFRKFEALDVYSKIRKEYFLFNDCGTFSVDTFLSQKYIDKFMKLDDNELKSKFIYDLFCKKDSSLFMDENYFNNIKIYYYSMCNKSKKEFSIVVFYELGKHDIFLITPTSRPNKIVYTKVASLEADGFYSKDVSSSLKEGKKHYRLDFRTVEATFDPETCQDSLVENCKTYAIKLDSVFVSK